MFLFDNNSEPNKIHSKSEDHDLPWLGHSFKVKITIGTYSKIVQCVQLVGV